MIKKLEVIISQYKTMVAEMRAVQLTSKDKQFLKNCGVKW